MPLSLICDLQEFHPTTRVITVPTDSYDVSALSTVVNSTLIQWFTNLPVNFTFEIFSADYRATSLLNPLIDVKVSYPNQPTYAVRTKWTTADQLIPLLQVGDKIEMKGSTSGGMSGGLPVYSHYALYTGKGRPGVPYEHDITHFAPPADCFSDSELSRNGKYSAFVQLDNLISYAKNRLCRINNSRDLRNEPRPADVVTDLANSSCDVGVGPYSLLKNNCEHFVNSCRYGQPASDQVESMVVAGTVISTIAMILGVLLAGTRFVLGRGR